MSKKDSIIIIAFGLVLFLLAVFGLSYEYLSDTGQLIASSFGR